MTKIKLADFLAWFGVGIGAAFISYSIRTYGYFNAVAPELFPLFIQSDVVAGAIQEMGGIFFAMLVLQFVVTNVRITMKEEGSARGFPNFNPRHILDVLVILAVTAFVASVLYANGDSYLLRPLFSFIVVVLLLGAAIVVYMESHQKPLAHLIGAVLFGFISLHEFGGYQAVAQWTRYQTRYVVEIDGKLYGDSVILRAGNNGILFRIGNDIIYVERSKVGMVKLDGTRIHGL